MTTIVLFHHALGVSTGLHETADGLRNDGHQVLMPDLFDGQAFATMADGVAYAESFGSTGSPTAASPPSTTSTDRSW